MTILTKIHLYNNYIVIKYYILFSFKSFCMYGIDEFLNLSVLAKFTLNFSPFFVLFSCFQWKHFMSFFTLCTIFGKLKTKMFFFFLLMFLGLPFQGHHYSYCIYY